MPVPKVNDAAPKANGANGIAATITAAAAGLAANIMAPFAALFVCS